jgi:predicted AAA+ superfamily ATPase
MKRDVYTSLVQWKAAPQRKPLILRGVRQSGKTYILKRFAEEEYHDFAYFNFEEDPDLHDFFEHKLEPARLIENLSLYTGKRIAPAETLIIFDEIQAAPKALNALKYIYEEANEFHVAAAGSLLGIRMSGEESFPVGKVNFLDLFPLTFMEFLDAMGKSSWRGFIEDLADVAPLPEPLHRDLIELLKRYYVVGGMPEAVDHYAQTQDLQEVRAIQKDILEAYALDFSKHAPPAEVSKISRVWKTIPGQLARENKKFTFTLVDKNARAREYEDAVEWLADAGLILRAQKVSKPGIPLSGYACPGFFKMYLTDVGLLGAMANLPMDIVVKGHHMFTEFNGALVENYAAQQMTAKNDGALFYWTSKGKAEVDFLVEQGGEVHPLEVKAGVNPKSKSLLVYDEKYNPLVLSRANLLNLKRDNRFCNYPLYAVSRFPFLKQK